MVGKEIAVKKYVVKLSVEERERLEALVRAGKNSAQLLTRARILLKADVSEAGEGWSDSVTAIALTCSSAPERFARWSLRLLEETSEMASPICSRSSRRFAGPRQDLADALAIGDVRRGAGSSETASASPDRPWSMRGATRSRRLTDGMRALRKRVGPEGGGAPFFVRNNVYLYDVRMEAGASVGIPAHPGWSAYICVFTGCIEPAGRRFREGESGLETEPETLTLLARAPSLLVVS